MNVFFIFLVSFLSLVNWICFFVMLGKMIGVFFVELLFLVII